MNKKNKKAFSLIEIMIILVIVSVSVLAAIPLTTSKVRFSTWNTETLKDASDTDVEMVLYGQDGDNIDRVGIGADPYTSSKEGKLVVNTMGVGFWNNNPANNYQHFIFGGINGTDCSANPKFFNDGEILDCGAGVNGVNDTNWSTDNINSLIIGRNYPIGNNAGATIVSSFAAAPANVILGTCIGNVTVANCDGAGEYSLNDVILISNTGTTFVNPADAYQPIIITPNTVTIQADNGLNIIGTGGMEDLYAKSYNYTDIVKTANPNQGPYIASANFNDTASINASDINYHDYTETTAQNNTTVTITDKSVTPNTNYTYATSVTSSGNTLTFAGNNAIPDGGTYDAPASTGGADQDTSLYPSDIRLKNILKPYEKGLDYISKIKTHYYTFKNDVEKKLHAGIIAQEIIGIFDEALETTKDGFYSYKKSPFLYAMVNSVKSLFSEQQDILKEQEELLKMIKNS